MPELPEVEVIRRGLIPHIVERRIISITCSNKKLRLAIPRADLARWVKGSRVQSIMRRGKYLLFSFDNEAAMIVHLGMSGKLGIFPANAPPALHDHVVFSMEDDMVMRYNDTRRFGFVRVLDPGRHQANNPFKNLGPEPLEKDFTAAYLKKKAGTRMQPIKNFLMDSKTVAGIGNIYANEILFYAGIQPTTPIGSLTPAIWGKVVDKTGQVLTRAIESGGSTINDFVNSSGHPGYFQLELMVYGREGERCKICSTSIKKNVIGGRSTFFCPRCQK